MSLAVLVIAGLLSLWGCPKKADVTATPEGQKEAAAAASSAGGSASEAASIAAASQTAREGAAAPNGGLQPVYFDFDKTFIRDEAKDAMKANAEWLKAHVTVKVRIEGNCDERGTAEYNQALGQRRAASAKRYLTDLGISSNRISLISYGKEKPICTEGAENCWQKNRRDDFAARE